MRKMLLFANSSHLAWDRLSVSQATSHPHQAVMKFSLPVESQCSTHPILVYMLGAPAVKLIFKATKASLVLSAADLCSNITMCFFHYRARHIPTRQH